MFFLCASAETLTWDGGNAGAWDTTAENWKTEGGTATAWIEGSSIIVPNGQVVNATTVFTVAGATLGRGATIGGEGALLLSGDVAVASGAASLSLPVWTGNACAKTGTGDLAANQLAGAMTVSGGRLLTGSFHGVRAAAVENGGTHVVMAADAAAGNLIVNGSFEESATAMSSAGYMYVKGSQMPTAWDNPSSSLFVRLNSVGGSPWNGSATILDGSYMVGFQRNGSASQTVTVSVDGFYELTYLTCKRSQEASQRDHFLEVTVDGVRRFSQMSVWKLQNPCSMGTGPMWLAAGTHVIGFKGEQRWGDNTTFVDDVRLRLCAAASAPTAANEVVLADGVSAAPAPVPDANGLSWVTKTGSGTGTVADPFPVPGRLCQLSVAGRLDFTGQVGGASGNPSLVKRGPGTAAFTGGLSSLDLTLVEGTMEVANASNFGLQIHTVAGEPATFVMDTSENRTASITALGTGAATVRTTGGAHTLAVPSACSLSVPKLTFDVGAGDLVQLPYLYELKMNDDTFSTDLVKTGPGRLQLTAGTPTNVGGTGLAGGTTLRDGTLELKVDDLAANTDHPLTNARHLYFPLLGAMTRPLQIGDAATPADAVLTVKTLKADFASARAVNVGAQGASVTIDASAQDGSACWGDIVLGRAETAVKGPATGFLALGRVSRAADLASSAKLVATGSVLIEGCTDANVDVVSTGELSFGRTSATPVTLGTLELSGAYALSYVDGVSPTVQAGTLRLGSTALKLIDRISGGSTALVGTRTLFAYDTLEDGDPERLLTLDAASRESGYTYTITHDATAKTISLTVSASADNPDFTWIATADAAWEAGAAWDHGAAPNGADVFAVFGPMATAPTTVTLTGAKTVGGVTFANTQGYTLTGGALALAPQDGTRPVLKVEYGTHVIASDVGTTDGGALAVEVAPRAKLVFDGVVNAPLDVISGTVGFGPNAQINANVTTAPDVTTAIDSTATLNGTATIEGALTGTGRLVKTGAGELSLATNPEASRPFSGTLAVEQGTLKLGVPTMDSATVELGASATMTVDPESHGLWGSFRRSGKSTNAEMLTICAKAFGLEAFEQTFNGLSVITNMFFGANVSSVFHVLDSDASAPTLPTACRQGGTNPDYWVAAWNGFLTVPESGVYEFSCKVDDAMLLAIDRHCVMQITNCLDVAGSVYLEKGPHAICIGMFEVSGYSKLPLNVKRPGATEVEGLPVAWLSPGVGAKHTSGAGTLAPADGTVLAVRQGSGVARNFTGTLAGAGTGALVLETQTDGGWGLFEISDWTGGIPYLQKGELAVAVPGRTLDAIGSDTGPGTINLIGADGVKSLSGGSITSLGAHLWARAIATDENCGLSTNKTYTHLVSFPLTGNTNPRPSVNGVTFDGRGTFEGTGPGSALNNTPAHTGFKSLFDSFSYGSTDYSFTLTGLTPGKIYDYRFYWMSYGVGTSGNGRRNGTFTFSGQDSDGNACTYQSYTTDLETTFGTVAKGSFGIVGCRYVAGPDGKLKVRVQSETASDTVHCYAFSNELLSPGSANGDRMTVAPEAGTRARLQGELNGTADTTIGGAGEQRIAGAVKMTKPLKVAGHLTLERGANVQSGVTLAGGTLEVRGGASLSAVSGAGALDFRWGDPRPFGALRDDGNYDTLTGFRVTNFTGDDDCGITPSKNYLLAMNYMLNASKTTFNYVNEIPFKQSKPTVQNPAPGEMYNHIDTRSVASVTLTGVPWETHAGGNADGIKLPATEGMYSILYAMTYANGQKDKDLPIKIGGLTAGKTYELRFWERLWELGKAEVRNVEFTFRPDGAAADETHMVKIDGAGKESPYYIAFRFTATSGSYTVTSKSLASDTWHLYGATIEQVEAGVTDRAVLDLAADSTVTGPVTGVGMVEKRGAGTLTLAGDAVNAKGFWYVRNGGLRLTDAAATLGSVAVGAEGTFGGRGSVTGDLGVSAGGTLVLDGTLQVGGKVAIGAGANVIVTGKPSCAAGTLALPSELTIKPTEKLTGRTTLFAGSADLTGIDLSGWTVCKPGEETVDRAAKVALAPDAKSVLLVPNAGTVLLIR